MKNIVELRQHLDALLLDLRSGEIEPKIAKEMNNTSGKIMNSLKIELAYADARKVAPSIKYLD